MSDDAVRVSSALGYLRSLGSLGVSAVGPRNRALIDLLVIGAAIYLHLWVLQPRGMLGWSATLSLLVVLWASGTMLRLVPVRQVLFSKRGRSLPAWGFALMVVAVQVGLIAVFAESRGVLESELGFATLGKAPTEVPAWLIGKLATVVAQQFSLYWLVFPLCFEISDSRPTTVVGGSLLFALAHAPNSFLMVAVVSVAPIWFLLFYRCGRLMPLVVSHLFLAVSVGVLLPSHIHLGMRAGATTAVHRERLEWLRQHDLWELVEKYSSPAYYDTRGGTDLGFVDGLFDDLLHRHAFDGEQEIWVLALEHGTRRETVIYFLLSPEYYEPRGLPGPEEDSGNAPRSREP